MVVKYYISDERVRRMNDLISIVIPIYNVVDYLEQCIESVINQTYKNIEIILVDDASTDGSDVLCDRYAKKDNRIRVIHHTENKKLTVTRRDGVNLAHGKYIVFVDGDDWIESNMYESLYNYMKNYNVQMVTSCLCREYEKSFIIGDELKPGKYYIDSQDKFIINHLFHRPGKPYLNGSICVKLHEIDIIKPILNDMNDDIHGSLDDTIPTILSTVDIHSIYVSDQCYYHHRERIGSYSHPSAAIIDSNYRLAVALKYLVKKIKVTKYSELVIPQIMNCYIGKNIYTYFELFGEKYNFIPKYFFLNDDINPNASIIIYGNGEVGQSYYKQFKSENKYNILAIADEKFDNKNVISPSEIINFSFEYIIIAVLNLKLACIIKSNLLDLGVPEDKIVFETPVNIIDYYNRNI